MICWLAALLGVALSGCAAPPPEDQCSKAQKALFAADYAGASQERIEHLRAEVARLCG